MAKNKTLSIHGFTLLELLVTISIIAITLSLAVPAMADFIQNQRLRAASNHLQTDLLYARSIAVSQGRQIVLCTSPDADRCDRQADWDSGWIIFNDINSDRQHQAGENILRLSTDLQLVLVRSSDQRRSIRFYPDGSAVGSAASISICAPSPGNPTYKLVIANSGRIRQIRIPLDSRPPICVN